MDDEYTYIFQGIGSGHGLPPEEAPRPPVKAILWLPDPEQRHGRREHYVRGNPAAARERQHFGFSHQRKGK
jgi:hypothetical protein